MGGPAAPPRPWYLVIGFGAMSLLHVAERERVVYLRVPEPVELGGGSATLARELADACAAVEHRL